MSTQPIDPRTNRPVGDHGSATDAIAYTLDGAHHDFDQGNALAFLEAWNEGGAFEEWPEFYQWLAKRETRRTN
jgi:hypothetical protein